MPMLQKATRTEEYEDLVANPVSINGSTNFLSIPSEPDYTTAFAGVASAEVETEMVDEFANEQALPADYDQLVRAKTALEEQMASRLRELEVQITKAREQKLQTIVGEIQSKIADFGLSPEQVFPGLVFRKARVFRDKYRNPETGETWTGRDEPPHWIAGKDYSAFKIQQATGNKRRKNEAAKAEHFKQAEKTKNSDDMFN